MNELKIWYRADSALYRPCILAAPAIRKWADFDVLGDLVTAAGNIAREVDEAWTAMIEKCGGSAYLVFRGKKKKDYKWREPLAHPGSRRS